MPHTTKYKRTKDRSYSSHSLSIDVAYPSGAYIIATIRNGYRVQRTFMGYTKKEAVSMFQEEFPN